MMRCCGERVQTYPDFSVSCRSRIFNPYTFLPMPMKPRIHTFILFLLCATVCITNAYGQAFQPLPRSLHFGGVIVGKSTTQVLSLFAGNIKAPLTITPPAHFAVSTNGDVGGRFFTTPIVCLLGSSGSITLTVRFKPSVAGRIEQTLGLALGSSGLSLSVPVPLTGDAIPPKPDVVRFAHERLYVRDEAFFPVGWSQIGTRDNYGIIGAAAQRNELRGVNFVENEGTGGSMNVGAGEAHSIWKADARDYNNLDTALHYLRRYLDTCEKGGVKTIINLFEYYANKQISGTTATGKASGGKSDNGKAGGALVMMDRKLSDADIRAIIGDSVIRTHPALLGWWISSEPVGKYGEVFNTLYDAKRKPYNSALSTPKTMAEVNAQINQYYPLQTELARWYRLAQEADGFRHPIGTMFQAGSMLEMTGMLHLYPNPAEPFWDFALAEHYNAYTPHNNKGLYYDIFERRRPLTDSIRVKNGDADGNFFYRNFRAAPPTTGLTQDDRLMNGDVHEYYSRFHPTGIREGSQNAAGGGMILKMFGHRYEEDTEQSLRPATLRELMFTTFTEIHALQNYPRPTVLGGIDLFGFDFFSSKIPVQNAVRDANGTESRAWGLTPENRAAREEQQNFLAFWSAYNLGMVFQSSINPELQGDNFATIQVKNAATGEFAKDSAAQTIARAIKRVVRYHGGYFYLALLNNRLNETMPESLTTGTARYTSWGAAQEFITTASVRVVLPGSRFITECVELSPRNLSRLGKEESISLESMTNALPNSAQILTIDTLDAAETRIYRFRVVHPTVARQALPEEITAWKQAAVSVSQQLTKPRGGTSPKKVSSSKKR